MEISEKELKANVAKMERGIPVIQNGKFMVVVDLSNGEQTTTWFTLAELLRHLTKYAPDVASAASAEPDSGLESVHAVESDTQPRG